MDASKPLILLAVKPKTPYDRERLDLGLQELTAEDPTIRVQTDQETGHTTIAGTGELHLEIIVDRLEREFDVEAAVGKPHVAYKATLTRRANGEGRYVRQGGGRGEYAHVKIRVFPGEPGSGYVFDGESAGDAIPYRFVEPVNDGIKEALTRGVLAGHPIDDVRIELYGGSYHDEDSSEIAFKIAGTMAFQDAASKAWPVLLEPVMRVEVVAPEPYIGEVAADLAGRRAQFESNGARDGMQIITARVPLSEMFGFATELRTCTNGRATYSMNLVRYEPVRGEPDLGESDRISPVGAPRTPTLKGRNSAIALPEPDDNGLQA